MNYETALARKPGPAGGTADGELFEELYGRYRLTNFSGQGMLTLSLSHPSDPGFLFQKDFWVGYNSCSSSISSSALALVPGGSSSLVAEPPHIGNPLTWNIASVTGSVVATVTGSGDNAVLHVDPSSSGGGTVTVRASDSAIPSCVVETTLPVATLEVSRNPLQAGFADLARVVPMPPGLVLDWRIAKHVDPALAATASARISPSLAGTHGLITDITGEGMLTITVTSPADPSFRLQGDVAVQEQCLACSTGGCTIPGSAWFQIASIDARFGLGKAANDQAAGQIILRAAVPDPANATPAVVRVLGLGHGEVIKEGGGIRQVVVPETFVDVVVVDEFGYEMRFYDPDARGALVDGLYEVVAGATPNVTWSIANPDRSATLYNRLQITEDRGGMINVTQYLWDPYAGAWTLSEANGERMVTRTETTSGSDRTERETVVDAMGVLASDTRTTYRTVTCGFESSEQIVERAVDPDDYFALVTTYDFYDDTGSAGSCGLLREQVNADGSWVRYEYDAEGRKSLEIHSWLGAPPGTVPSAARVIHYDYTPVDPSDTQDPENARLPRTVREEILGTPVSKTLTVYRSDTNGRSEIVERAGNAAASFGAPDNERTETTYYPFGTGLVSEGRIESVLSPDGRLDTYSYERGSYAASALNPGSFTPGLGSDLRETVVHGTLSSPEGLALRTTREKRITDTYGNLLLEETYVYTGVGEARLSWTAYALDDLGRVITVAGSDGSIRESRWTCCGKESDTDALGVTTFYTYDALNRVETETRPGPEGDIVTTYEYDAEGRMLSETTTAGELSQATTSHYDPKGRLWVATDAAGRSSIYNYYYDPYGSAGHQTTLRRPGGATEVTARYRDGRVQSVAGSGVVAKFYTYGVNADGTRWTRVSHGTPGSAQWEVTTTDHLGRTIRVEKPAFGGGSESTAHFFNHAGQLERTVRPGLADTLYEYDGTGNLLRTGLDVDANGILEPASADRIEESDTSFDYDGVDWWQQTEQRVYPTEGEGSPVTTAVQRTRLTGLGLGLVSETVSVDVHGNETVSRVWVDRATATETRTTDFPDSANDAVDISVNGLLISSQSKTGVTLSYGYDALGRRTHTTDPRTGTTSLQYDALGQVEWTEDAALNRTRYTYEPDTGRLALRTNAKDFSTRYAYDSRDQITHVWGDGAVPVRYVYDGMGRKAEMHTYRDESVDWNTAGFPAAPGTADVTTWHYEPATGLLTAKEDAATKSVNYTYTTGGKLETRTWARSDSGSPLVTTYGYDPDTAELTSIDYSDGTPDVDFTYDRLGRQKTVTDAVGSRTFIYDPLTLQLEDEVIVGLYGTTLTRSYQGAGGVPGRSEGMKIDASYEVTYVYDSPAGRFNGVTWTAGAGSGAVTYAYLPDSDLLHQKAASNGPLTTFGYEPLRDLVTQVKHESAGTTLAQYDYQHDELSQRTSVQSSGQAVTQPWSPAGESSYGISYDPNALNQYAGFTVGNSPAVALSYDDDGNLVSRSEGPVVRLYTYDAENRLTGVEPATPSSGDTKLEFLYDYMGRRARKVVWEYVSGEWAATEEVLFVYDGWNLVQERYADGLVKRHYVWGLDLSGTLQGAGGIGGLLFATDGLTGYHYLYDANGNVGQLVAAPGGALTAHYDYDPFGQEASAGGFADNPFRFSTKYTDDEAGLVYYGYRYYSPELGRWLTRDPLEELGFNAAANKSEDEYSDLEVDNIAPEDEFNLYAFVQNSPIDNFDMFGLRLITTAEVDSYGLLTEAASWMGTPYASTKADKGVAADCSGAVWGIYNNVGLTFLYQTKPASADFPKSKCLQQVSTPQAGDIGWWNGHVLIYDPNSGTGTVPDKNTGKPRTFKADSWSAYQPGKPFNKAKYKWFGVGRGPVTWYRYDFNSDCPCK